MANSKNNPEKKQEVARVVKHAGGKERCVVGSPKKEEPVFVGRVVEPCPTIREGKDGVWRVWDSNGHMLDYGDQKTMESLMEKLMVGSQDR